MKYELLKHDCKTIAGHTLYRIRALKDFGNVAKGDLGGYIENEKNLSQFDEARVFGEAKVFDNARVSDNAYVFDEAKVFGNAFVAGEARVSSNAEIESSKDYIVFKNNWSSGRYFTYTKSNKMWRVGCFYGTGQELIEKAYKDSELSGRCYELYVNLAEDLERGN